jgi:hypothetical protein
MEQRFFGRNPNASVPATIMFILLGRLTSPIPELRVKTHDRGLGDGGAARRHSLGGIIVMIMFPSVNTALVSMDFLGSFIALVRP